jgi:C4-dicarboxylate transporter DctM subunit
MSATEIGILGTLVLVILLVMGVHVGFGMIIVGFIGFGIIGGFDAALSNLAILPFDKLYTYNFAVLPLFLLMGTFVSGGGLGREAYAAARAWLGRFKGGLAMATIGACGLFAAVSGDSFAGAMVMGKVAYPEMKKLGYKDVLTGPTIAAGGTLGILIPPSMGFVFLGIMANIPISKLFIAGILPGILVIIMYMATIIILCKINPSLAPSVIKTTWKEKGQSVTLAWGIVVLFLLVMGGIYGGIFTATEAGAVGAVGAVVISVVKRQLYLKGFGEALMEAGKLTAMIIIMLIGSYVFNAFLAITQIPFNLSNFLINLQMPTAVIVAAVLIVYIILGCFFDIFSILILTVPVIFPAMQALGLDMIWYSVLMVRIIEIGVITPPFGINLFGLTGIIKVPLGTLYRGIMPFVVSDVVNIAILACFPIIVTFLPNLMS